MPGLSPWASYTLRVYGLPIRQALLVQSSQVKDPSLPPPICRRCQPRPYLYIKQISAGLLSCKNRATQHHCQIKDSCRLRFRVDCCLEVRAKMNQFIVAHRPRKSYIGRIRAIYHKRWPHLRHIHHASEISNTRLLLDVCFLSCLIRDVHDGS